MHWEARLFQVVRRAVPSLGPIATAAAVIAWWRLGGSWSDARDSLIYMGFDPGRAVLLGALLLGALTAAVVSLVTGRTRPAIVLGLVAGLIADAGSIRRDTLGILAAHAVGEKLDPIGWLLTVLAIAVAALILAWAGATLAVPVRGWIGRGARALLELRRDRRLGRSALLPAGLVAGLVVLLIVSPVLGDLLNYGTDARMHAGGQAPSALFGAGGPVAAGGGTGAGSGPGAGTGTAGGTGTIGSGAGSGANLSGPIPAHLPGDLVAGPVRGSLVTPGALSLAMPWSSSVPTGQGTTQVADLPHFFVGPGTSKVDVYLPPGYASQPNRRYPVVYELPDRQNTWDLGMHLTATLDSLITAGQLPPMIVVYVGHGGSPFVDPECSDSRDGREWFDRWLATTVVPWVDATFRTIPSAAARTAMGASKGGYCAASALTHHPDLFGSAITFSGYYAAGLVSTQTIGDEAVFGADPVYEATQSPILRLATIPAALRQGLFVVIEADPAAATYGSQMRAFAAALDRAKIAQALLPTPLGHSWDAQRTFLPVALRLVAARQVKLGVFGPGG